MSDLSAEPHDTERWEINDNAPGLSLPFGWAGWHGERVYHAAAGVTGGVGVDEFAVAARFGDADAVAFARHGRGIDDAIDFVPIWGFAHEGEDAVVGVAGIQPFEATAVVVERMERGAGGVEPVEVTQEFLQRGVLPP